MAVGTPAVTLKQTLQESEPSIEEQQHLFNYAFFGTAESSLVSQVRRVLRDSDCHVGIGHGLEIDMAYWDTEGRTTEQTLARLEEELSGHQYQDHPLTDYGLLMPLSARRNATTEEEES